MSTVEQEMVGGTPAGDSTVVDTDVTDTVVTDAIVAHVPGGEPEDGLLVWVHSDPELMASCSAAVDPLEIAARLETYGMSSRVAVDTFGYPDVFSAAQAVYDSLPFGGATPPEPELPPMGGPLDLLRGALYAIPALLFTVAVHGFGVVPRWWALPVGLTTAWAVSEAVAVLGWTMRGLDDTRSDALLGLGSVLITATLCFGLASGARWWLGGAESSVVVATALAVYIAAGGVLLFHNGEWLLTLCLLPAAVGSFLALRYLPFGLSDRTAAWTVVASGVLVTAAANRYLFSRRWRWPTVHRLDRQRALHYLLYGLGCGLFTATFIGFAATADPKGGALVIAVWPLLLTLGLMEWHLRSFRSRATAATRSSTDLHQFGRRVRFALLRSLGTYVVALAALSAVGLVVAKDRHATMVPLLLATVGLLGVAFFLALLVESSGHVKLVLGCWAIAFTVLGGVLAVAVYLWGRVTPTIGLVALLAAVAVAIAYLSVAVRAVLTSPLNY